MSEMLYIERVRPLKSTQKGVNGKHVLDCPQVLPIDQRHIEIQLRPR